MKCFFCSTYYMNQILYIILYYHCWKMELKWGPRQERGKTVLTTAFLGLACSWCISISCSGLALWTRLSTLNQPLSGVRESAESKGRRSQQIWKRKLQHELPLTATRGNFISTHHIYKAVMTKLNSPKEAAAGWGFLWNIWIYSTWHLLGTLHRCGTSSPQSQYSVHFPSHDCPLYPCRKNPSSLNRYVFMFLSRK